MAKIRTHYDNLNVARTADIAVIKAAYKALAQKYHPDRNPDNPNAEWIMQIINKAYEVLSDPIKRAEHDRWIDEQERRAGQSYQSTRSNTNQNSSTHQNKANSSSFDNQSNKHTSQNATHPDNDDQKHYDGNNSTNTSSYSAKKSSENDGKKDTGSWFGTFFVPTTITLILAKILLSIGVLLGFLGFILSYMIYNICYGYTYDFIKLHKIVKEFFAIIAGIIGVIIFVFSLLFIADIFSKKLKYNAQDDTKINTLQTTTSYQNTKSPNITNNDIVTPNINNEPQLNPQLVLAEAQKRYDNAIANINAVWNSLHPNTQEFLRVEQRAINKKREADCITYGNAQSTDKDLAMAYRYLCEIPQLNERVNYLKTQLNTVVVPPTPMMEPQPLPKTGATNKPNLHGNSPLQIKTNAGSHYWVKIVNSYNEKDELASFFIRGGETLDVNLPIGSYVVKYAYGDIWYGRDYLFGENTGYSKADEVLEFYRGQGYVIELIQQLNGNLHTTAIDESQF